MQNDFLIDEFAAQRARTGWLMVAGFVIFTVLFCYGASAHDTVLQGAPHYGYAENMMGLDAIMSIPPLLGIVMAGLAMLAVGAVFLVAYYWPDETKPPEPVSKIARADEWLRKPPSLAEIERQLAEDERKARMRRTERFKPW
jgi:hypothetical protein